MTENLKIIKATEDSVQNLLQSNTHTTKPVVYYLTWKEGYKKECCTILFFLLFYLFRFSHIQTPKNTPTQMEYLHKVAFMYKLQLMGEIIHVLSLFKRVIMIKH